MEMRPHWYLSKEEWRKEKKKLKLFCMEYTAMRMQLEDMVQDIEPGSPGYDGMPKSHNNTSAVEKRAIKLAMMQDRIDVIHLAAEQTDFCLAEFIVKHVTSDKCSYDILKKNYEIPISKAGFYNKVEAFYRNLYELKYGNNAVFRSRIKCRKARRDWAHYDRRR